MYLDPLTKQITILILTFNRYSYLKRLLLFYRNLAFSCSFIILDSSSQKPTDSELIELLEQDHVRWLQFDQNIFFAQKIQLALEHIHTPYATLCAEDDFILPNGISYSIKFLEGNPDYSCAHGRYLIHDYSTNKVRLWPANTKAQTISHLEAEERFLHFFPINFGGYPLYAVHRTATFKKVWEITSYSVSYWGLSEIVPSCLSLIYGKMKMLRILYASKEVNTFNWITPEVHKKIYSQEKLQKSIQTLSDSLIEASSISTNKARDCVENQFCLYFEMIEAKRQRLFKSTTVFSKPTSKLKKLVIPTYWPSILMNRIVRYSWMFNRDPFQWVYPHWKLLEKAIIESGANADEITQSRKTYSEAYKS